MRGNCFLRGTSSDLAKLQPGVVGTFVTTLMHAVRLVRPFEHFIPRVHSLYLRSNVAAEAL